MFKKSSGKERRRRAYSNALAETFFCPANYFKNGSMICCKLKTKTKAKHKHFSQIGRSSPDHCNTDKAIRWLDSIQCPLGVLTATDTASGNPCHPGAHRGQRETQRHRGVQSAEERCGLSSQTSAVFFPVVLSAVRGVPLADEGGNCSSVLGPLGWCLCVSCGRCSWLAIWPPLMVCCHCCHRCCHRWSPGSTFFSFL